MKAPVFTFTYKGYAHRKARKPCQDYCAFKAENDCVAVALADGAGSAPLSHIGAKITSMTFVSYFSHSPDRTSDLTKVIDRIKRNIARKAKMKGASISDFATTLIGAVLYQDELSVVHIGDGIVVDGAGRVISEGVRGEFANQTSFVTSSNPKAVTETLDVKPPFSIALMSDGGEHVFFDKLRRRPAPALYKVIELTGKREKHIIRKMLKRAVNRLDPASRYDDISLAILKVME
jgi:hypothetical protein